MQPQVIVALDVPDRSAARRLTARLPRELSWVKIGLELFCAEGPAIVTSLRELGKQVFLDLKFHDIPRTAARAVSAAGRLGASMMTIHAAGGAGMIAAAAAAASHLEGTPKLVAVTTLTSLDRDDLRQIGVADDPAGQADRLARLAIDNGADGVVTSVHEAAALRERFGSQPLLVTPGIRLAGDQAGDQKRVATPALAVQEGSSFLVVGRSITAAADPHAAGLRVLDEVARAFADSRD